MSDEEKKRVAGSFVGRPCRFGNLRYSGPVGKEGPVQPEKEAARPRGSFAVKETGANGGAGGKGEQHLHYYLSSNDCGQTPGKNF